MVSEVAKAQAHGGFSPRLFHYRESRGPEVDLLVQSGNGWTFAEAKSSSTVDASFFRPMEDLSSRFPEGTAIEKRLIHGGEATHTRQGVAVTGWARIQDQSW